MKTILYFSAPWCKSCKNLAPHLAKVEAAGKVKVMHINVEEDPRTAEEYDVMQLPTMVFLQEDAIIDRKSGFSDSVVEALNEFAK